MKFRGLLVILLMVAVIWAVMHILKVGGTAKIKKDVETFSRAKVMLTETNFKTLSRAVSNYVATQGELPAGLEDLSMSLPITTGKQDGWGRVIRYEQTGGGAFRLTSAGPDGRFGTKDDIAKNY